MMNGYVTLETKNNASVPAATAAITNMKRNVLCRYTRFKQVPPFGMASELPFMDYISYKLDASPGSFLKYTVYNFKRFDLIFKNPFKIQISSG
jgi:hypothetical protein